MASAKFADMQPIEAETLRSRKANFRVQRLAVTGALASLSKQILQETNIDLHEGMSSLRVVDPHSYVFTKPSADIT